MLINLLKQLDKLMRKIMGNRKKKNKMSDINMYATIPEDIKLYFGKFYLYSLVYIVFFGILYPFFLMYYLNIVFSMIILIILALLYVYIIYDINRRTRKYISNMFFFLIILVILSLSFSFINLIS